MNEKILIINGPNLGILEKRNKAVYGGLSLKTLENEIREEAKKINCDVDFFQSDIEGEIISEINKNCYDGIILNAGAYSHYSIAIRDAIEASSSIVIEVHISNIFARENFRQRSVIAPVCSGIIAGFGFYGYRLALRACVNIQRTQGEYK